MSTWFISDLHLAPEETRITAGFLDFMLKPQAGDSLYILGDFFNYWVGDDVTSPYSDQIQQVLRATKERGVSLYFMHGNRDFLIGDTFCQASGMTLLSDPTIIELDGESVVLMHGDSLCTRDLAYMGFRKMARDPQWQSTFLKQPVEKRLAYAQKARSESQANTQMKDELIMDVTPSEVDATLVKHHSKRMIHGHTHRPATHHWQHKGQEFERIVLGDWYTKGWYLKVDNGQYKLVEFDLPQA